MWEGNPVGVQEGNSAKIQEGNYVDEQGSLVSRSTDAQGNTAIEINLDPSRTEHSFWPFLPPLRVRMDYLGRHVALESVERIERIRQQETAQIVADALKSIGNERKKTKKMKVEIANIASASRSEIKPTNYLTCIATTSSYCACPACDYKRSRWIPSRTLILLLLFYVTILYILQRIIQPHQQQTIAQVLGVCLNLPFNLHFILVVIPWYFKNRFCRKLAPLPHQPSPVQLKLAAAEESKTATDTNNMAAKEVNESCEIVFENVCWLKRPMTSTMPFPLVHQIYLILLISALRIFLDQFDWNTLPIWNWSWEITLTEFLVAQKDGFLTSLIVFFAYDWYALYFRSISIQKFFLSSHFDLTHL